MKKSKYLIFVIICTLLVLPIYANACSIEDGCSNCQSNASSACNAAKKSNSSNGKQNQKVTGVDLTEEDASAVPSGSGNTGGCLDDCGERGRSGSGGGVRITFVNQYGMPISASYDFTTKTNNYTTKYNAAQGDKTRFTGSYSAGSGSLHSLPKLSALVAAFNAQPGVTQSPLRTSGDTGGNNKNTWAAETAWFLSLTSSKNATNNVNGIIWAISEFYPLNAEEMILRTQKGCYEGEEVYIIMEPLDFYFYNYQKGHFLGTVADYVHEFGKLPPSVNNVKTYITYRRRINAPNWQGFDVYTSSYTIQSTAQITDRIGWGVALDWASGSKTYCGSCQWIPDTKTLIYEDKKYPGDFQIPSGFRDIGEFVFTDVDKGGGGCCQILDQWIDDMPEVYKKAYDELCSPQCSILPDGRFTCLDRKECTQAEYEEQCGALECCMLSPITPGHVEKDINNCCNDNTHSWIKEYELNDLFCYSSDLKVDHYYKKCNIGYYLEDDAQLNDYCEMYCTERLTVDIPGAITATSGRYFTLNSNPVGTASPYIDGYRRCRILVDYEKWETDYGTQVDTQVLEYNSYQKNRAYELMYEDAIDNSTEESKDITVTCEAKTQSQDCSYTVGTGPDATTEKQTVTSSSADSVSKKFTIKYTKYPFPEKYFRKWYTVKVDEDLRQKYQEYRIKATNDNNKTSHTNDWSAWDIRDQIKAVEDYMNSLDGKEIENTSVKATYCDWSVSSKWSCTRNKIDAESRQEDVVSTEQTYHDNAETANELYNAAADKAFSLEEDLDKCDFYFETGTKGQYAGVELPGADPKENYDMEPSMYFYYTQIYLDDIGERTKDTSFVQFAPAFDPDACRYTISTTPDEEITAPNYSQVYKDGKETVHDFKNSKLEWEKTNDAFKKYLDDPYGADKMFTHDAKYRAECYWYEDENQINTLVPNGFASGSTDELNYSTHNREYRVYLTTFDGTYETYFDIQGLGSEGRFDKYFREGTTCSGQSADTGGSELLTCTLHVEYEIVLTGYCNGVATEPEECDTNNEGYTLFNFKSVDPENLFPSGTVDAETGKSFAYNWVNTSEGQEALAKIQSAGANSKTYAPENLTYAFRLTPGDMAHIKSYNLEHEFNGGYSDFNLNCNCPSKDADGYSGACTKCKSVFLTNLADGKVVYDRTDHDVSGWINSQKSIEAVRNSNNW